MIKDRRNEVMNRSIVLENFSGRNYVHVEENIKFEENIMGLSWLPLFVVYENLKDFPGKYVVRLHRIDRVPGEVKATPYCVIKDSLEEVRQAIPKNLYRFGRESSEDPAVIEKWI